MYKGLPALFRNLSRLCALDYIDMYIHIYMCILHISPITLLNLLYIFKLLALTYKVLDIIS